MATFGIIRHGSTHWNKEGRAQGSSDIPLDGDGIAQAKLLAQRLKHDAWDVIFSSNLLRAKQTAEIVGTELAIEEVLLDERLREAGGGLIEGTTEAERIAKWGTEWRNLDLGLESFERVTARGSSFFEEIAALYPNKQILVVSHGSFIRQVLMKMVPQLNQEVWLGNTSLTKLELKTTGWECSLFNCMTHLEKSR